MFDLTEVEIYIYSFLVFGIILSWLTRKCNFDPDIKQEEIINYNLKLTMILSIVSLFVMIFESIYLRLIGLNSGEITYYMIYGFFFVYFFLFFIPGFHGIKNRKLIPDQGYRLLNNFGLFLGLAFGTVFVFCVFGYCVGSPESLNSKGDLTKSFVRAKIEIF